MSMRKSVPMTRQQNRRSLSRRHANTYPAAPHPLRRTDRSMLLHRAGAGGSRWLEQPARL